MRDYRKLDVWKIARENNKVVYNLTSDFPRDEVFALTNQMRRASVSIISNIAEGCSRDSVKEFIYYLQVSMGSLKELESQFYVASDVGYLSEQNFNLIMESLDKLSKKLWKYIQYLKMQRSGGEC
jgi:four helix bundle protein